MRALLPSTCSLCPRQCRANRAGGQAGRCGADDSLRIARAALHYWEEPPISGYHGSGTVFFSNCPLRCVYCQNAPIASGEVGKEVSVDRLARIFLELQQAGALNINLVTPTHYIPQIKHALDLARDQGLTLPIVYNTSGYEAVETIQSLGGYVDIYLFDFKYADPALAQRYSQAPDYPEVARAALAAAMEQVGNNCLEGFDYPASSESPRESSGDDEDREPIPLLKRGVILRHLMLPGQLEDSKMIVSYVLETYGDRLCLSLMNQYTPMPGLPPEYPELARRVSEEEYSQLVDFALDKGAENSFMQVGETASESFIPDFDYTGV